MDRKTFLRRAAILTTGIIAADQLELLEKLNYKRKFFPGTSFSLDPETYTAVITEVDVFGSCITLEWQEVQPGPIARLDVTTHLRSMWFQVGDTLKITYAPE